MRLRRGSRGFGAFVSVAVMLVYYLLMIGGEQMARGGTLPALLGAWLATIVTISAWQSQSRRQKNRRNNHSQRIRHNPLRKTITHQWPSR